MMNAIVAGVALWIEQHGAVRQNDTTHRTHDRRPARMLPRLGSRRQRRELLSIVFTLAAIVATWWLRQRTDGRTERCAPSAADQRRADRVGISVGRVQLLVDDRPPRARSAAGLGCSTNSRARITSTRSRRASAAASTSSGSRPRSSASLQPAGIEVSPRSCSGSCRRVASAVGSLVPKELTEMLQGVVLLAIAVAGWTRPLMARWAPYVIAAVLSLAFVAQVIRLAVPYLPPRSASLADRARRRGRSRDRSEALIRRVRRGRGRARDRLGLRRHPRCGPPGNGRRRGHSSTCALWHSRPIR